jgi:hypothetical protein
MFQYGAAPKDVIKIVRRKKSNCFRKICSNSPSGLVGGPTLLFNHKFNVGGQ